MAVRRFLTHVAASVLMLAAVAGPLSPSAVAEPDPNDPEGTVSLESLTFSTPDTVTAVVSYSCSPETATFLAVGYEEELDEEEEAAGSAEIEEITCDDEVRTVTVDIPRSEGGADYTDPATGQVVVTLAGTDEPVVEEEFVVGEEDEERPRRSLGRSKTSYRWKQGVVPYLIDAGLSRDQQNDIRAAMAHWERKTPIRFVERAVGNARKYPDYVAFQPSKDGGCGSVVGRTGGQQGVYVPDWCGATDLIHEIGHTVGLMHEHSRPDRDKYVTVSFENMAASAKPNFQIRKESTFGTAYDFASIMHYGATAASKNGKNTITPKQKLPAGVVMGAAKELSAGDIAGVKAMYE
ncbi:M12 family metallopeptidase [Streptomyces sp. TLI_053]|uniref:M12 family metallopeptidase n=1 Tax=Streptomyces sp. TLI_053 TaxID=1855352 RepID=UPI0013520EE5|nr:M12 family metallopeptidase [Streptomyces sp. TLI_053]